MVSLPPGVTDRDGHYLDPCGTARALLDRLPKDQPPRGMKPNWGSERDAAYAIAARLGHYFDPKCQSCDADVMDVLIQAAK